MKTTSFKHLLKDLAILLVSIWVAVWLKDTGSIGQLANLPTEGSWIAGFVAGLFFTSLLTTAPAIVVLGVLAQRFDPLMIALTGAVGALIGDWLLLVLFKSHVEEDVVWLIKQAGWHKFWRLMRRARWRWVATFLGGAVIASPLPDELGIAIMGIGRTSLRWFVPVSLGLNFVGILVIGWLARSLF